MKQHQLFKVLFLGGIFIGLSGCTQEHHHHHQHDHTHNYNDRINQDEKNEIAKRLVAQGEITFLYRCDDEVSGVTCLGTNDLGDDSADKFELTTDGTLTDDNVLNVQLDAVIDSTEHVCSEDGCDWDVAVINDMCILSIYNAYIDNHRHVLNAVYSPAAGFENPPAPCMGELNMHIYVSHHPDPEGNFPKRHKTSHGGG